MSQQQCTVLPKRDDTRNRQHVLLMRDTFCTGERIERCLYGSRKLAMYRMHACASARFRDRCIVPIDVPCVLHLCVHVWVRHRRLLRPISSNCTSPFPSPDHISPVLPRRSARLQSRASASTLHTTVTSSPPSSTSTSSWPLSDCSVTDRTLLMSTTSKFLLRNTSPKTVSPLALPSLLPPTGRHRGRCRPLCPYRERP